MKRDDTHFDAVNTARGNTAASIENHGCKYVGVSTTPEGGPSVLAVPPAEAARMLSLSRPMIYKLIHSGELRTVNIGRTRRVPVSELERLIDVNGHDGDTNS
jgi:excisionase family DNA binding protein